MMAIYPSTSASTSDAATGGTVAPIVAIVRRLIDILDQETMQLERNEVGNLSDFIDQKSRSLLDLNRALSEHEAPTGIAGLDDELVRLRHAFQSNRDMLGIHLASVQEITEVIAAAMRHAESDGTYSTRIYAR
jgi:flagellar biosynthesis/type III secretory pathway chaperone